MIFDLSTVMPKSIIEGKPRTEIVLDFAPGEGPEKLERLMRDNEGLWLEETQKRANTSDPSGKRLLDRMKSSKSSTPDPSPKGWKEAQTTLGGVPLSEIFEETGESRLCKGLFFAGEILEPAFICGGYNLDHAWVSGLRAGSNL